MSLSFKEGVIIGGIKKATIEAMSKVAIYFDWRYQEDVVITSVSDGKHKVGSKHYTGEAFDIRTWTTPYSGVQVTQGKKNLLCYDIQKMLGEDYDVIAESTHIHIEYDPS
jgi:hypothetical protein